MKTRVSPESESSSFAPEDFWTWFCQHEDRFHRKLISGTPEFESEVEDISTKLAAAAPGLYPLIGKAEGHLAEFIVSPDGRLRNFDLAVDFVAAAPVLSNWKFTALKPKTDDFRMEMGGLEFNEDKLTFVPQFEPGRPDSVMIDILHRDGTEDNYDLISNAVLIFLDNYLGEEFFAKHIERARAVLQSENPGETRPISQLESYLINRQRAFVDVHAQPLALPSLDDWSLQRGTNGDGERILAMINSGLLEWPGKTGYPWLISATLSIYSSFFRRKSLSSEVEALEKQLSCALPTKSGYLHLGHVSTGNSSTVYLGCREFERAAKIMRQLENSYSKDSTLKFEIYHDRYWSELDMFNPKAKQVIN